VRSRSMIAENSPALDPKWYTSSRALVPVAAASGRREKS